MTNQARSERWTQRIQRHLVSLILWCLAALASLHAGANPAQARTAIVTGTEWVFIRRGPGNQFPPFARIPSGSTVEVQEVRDDWAQIITASGQVGFIHTRFLSFPEAPHPGLATVTPRDQPAGMSDLPPTPWHQGVRSEVATIMPTPVPTRTPPPTRTPRATRTPFPTRTLTATRTITPTRSPSLTRTAPPTRTPSPTVTSPAVGNITPTAPATQATRRETATPTVIGEALQQLSELEAELLATRQQLAACRQQNPSSSLATCPQELREELLRLRALIEQRNAGTELMHQDGGGNAGGTGSPAASADNHVVTPLAVLLGSVGFMLGWFGGSRYARRAERRRIGRLRFQ
ncbi:MAG: SH3 domain-containing protein [Candidatus Binatia bacterium]|nr:SH3 domain-containing protein [Candidatus Binatia bacterium]